MRCLHCHKDNIALSAQVCPHCGVFLPELYRNLLPLGMLLNEGRYRIEEVMGRGGFGVTYRATHVALHKTVAIKEFFPREHAARNTTTWQIIIGTQQQPLYERGLKRFEREGQTLAELRHPNIVGINHLFIEHNTAYLEMEFLEGHTIKEELSGSPDGRLPEARVRRVMETLIAALTVAHAKAIYHLDVKPENVMVEPAGRVVLIDFGAARRGMGTLSTQSFTPGYAPPELMSEASEPGPESDIFELGMMLHEMLTGTLPPDAMSRAMDQVRDIHWHPNGLAEPWRTLVETALPLAREARPQDVQAWWAQAATVKVVVCAGSGLLPSADCPKREERSFAAGQEPRHECSLHTAPQATPTQPLAPPPLAPPPLAPPPEPRKKEKSPAAPKPQRGADVRVEVTVTAAEARSGCRKAYGTREAGQGIVEIPSNARQGQQVRLTGRGQAGQHGGPPGDLIATIRVPSAPAAPPSKVPAVPAAPPSKVPSAPAAPPSKVPAASAAPPAKVATAPSPAAPSLLLRAALPAGAVLLLLGLVFSRGWFGRKPQPTSTPGSAVPVLSAPAPTPAQTVNVEVCAASGLLPTFYCPKREKRNFVVGREPRQKCSLHTAATRAAANRQLARGVARGDVKLVTAALDAGADIETRLDNEGQTALITAAARGAAPLARLLLKHGAKVNAQDYLGESALLEAAARGYVPTALVLFEGGAEKCVNLVSKQGITPLIAATAYDKTEMVRLLLAHKADVTVKERSEGKTALQWARSDAVRSLLKAYGASE